MKKFVFFFIAFTLFIATSIYFAFTYGTDWLSSIVADVIPMEIQKQIGKASLQSMDAQSFEKSSLPFYTQNKIRQKFFQLVNKDSNEITLLFRNAPYPNAFALPGNYIVILDSLVRMSKDTIQYADVMGVLGHEAGHLHYKHSLRLMIKAGITGIIIGYLIGDFSSFVATTAHQLLSLSYSREFEEQADDYAILLLHKNKISTIPLAKMLEKISQPADNEEIPVFLSTHPVTKERVKKLRDNQSQ
ncbi:MAG: metalloprotease [Bacteroidia bacterium]|nr:MAG: metalloprotease [Bacteroidia bacterium]